VPTMGSTDCANESDELMAQPAFIKTTGGLLGVGPRPTFRETLAGSEVGNMLGFMDSRHWKERLFGRRDVIVYIDEHTLRAVPFSCFSYKQLVDRLG
jgi:hypothetical protein